MGSQQGAFCVHGCTAYPHCSPLVTAPNRPPHLCYRPRVQWLRQQRAKKAGREIEVPGLLEDGEVSGGAAGRGGKKEGREIEVPGLREEGEVRGGAAARHTPVPSSAIYPHHLSPPSIHSRSCGKRVSGCWSGCVSLPPNT